MPDSRDSSLSSAPPSPPLTPLPPLPRELSAFASALAGRYAVVRELGRGGMATVYLARDVKHDRLVALKVLSPELGAVLGTERFLAEIRVTANLQHPHLLALFDSGEAAGLLFYVMPYVEGESLRARLEREKQLPVGEAVRIAVAVAHALDYAHGHGVIHRDLKPENILLQHGQPVVADFGIALAVSNAGGNRITQTGLSLGTPQYMSPEQATGDRVIDGRTDIYSLGAVLYEMLAGEPPHTGNTAQAVIARLLTEAPRPVTALRRTVLPHVAAAVERALEKLPADRFATAREMADALEGRFVVAPVGRPTPAPAAGGVVRGRRTLVAVGAVVALAALGTFAAGARWGAPTSPLPTEWVGEVLGGSLVALAPAVSPDGQSVAFEAMVDNLTQAAVVRPGSGDWLVLTHDRSHGNGTFPTWSRDGTRIYYQRLFEVPRGIYSVSSLGGEERLVLEDAGWPEVLPDGSLLVARLNADRVLQMHRYWPETGRLQPLGAVAAPGHRLYYRGFPDGKEAVFIGRPPGDSTAADHLHVVDLETGRTRRIAPRLTIPPPLWEFPLAVTLDGQWVLFDQPAGDLHRIVAVPRDGGEAVQTVLTLNMNPARLQAAVDGSLYVDQRTTPNELLRYSPGTGRLERRRIPPTGGPVLALPDGRVLIPVHSAGRMRLMVVAPGKDPVPFIETTEETWWPTAMLGRDRVLLVLGSAPNRVLAVASLATGRIVGRLRPVGAERLQGLAGAPDGKTVFFAAGGVVWAMPSAGGEPRRIRAGDGVAIDPAGRYLVVKLNEAAGVRLVRVPLAGGAEEPIAVDSDLRLTSDYLSPNAVGPDGRIAVRVASATSWFWPAAILDPRTGRLDPITLTFDRDMGGPGWGPDGAVVTQANGFESSLWRFRPARRDGEGVAR